MPTCPSCGAKIAEAGACNFCADPELRRRAGEPKRSGEDLRDPLPVKVDGVCILGGTGLPLRRDQIVHLNFDRDGMEILSPPWTHEEARFTVRYTEIRAIEIQGPGTVQHGGGFFGGGLGIEGALVGMAVAGVLNALTSRSETITIIFIGGSGWEFWGATGECDPLTLRILLSPIFVRITPHRRDEHES